MTMCVHEQLGLTEALGRKDLISRSPRILSHHTLRPNRAHGPILQPLKPKTLPLSIPKPINLNLNVQLFEKVR